MWCLLDNLVRLPFFILVRGFIFFLEMISALWCTFYVTDGSRMITFHFDEIKGEILDILETLEIR